MQELREQLQSFKNQSNTDDRSHLLFVLGGNIYAIDCQNVIYMSKLNKEKVLPNVRTTSSSFRRGAIDYEGKIIGLIDMRKLFGMRSQLEEHHIDLNISQRIKDHENWINELKKSVLTKTPFTLTDDPNKCILGKWINSFQNRTRDNVILNALKKVIEPHEEVHAAAGKVEKLMQNDKQEEALETIEHVEKNAYRKVVEALNQLEKVLMEHMYEMEIVVKGKECLVGLIVDDVIKTMHLKELSAPTPGIPEVVDFISQREKNALEENGKNDNDIVFVLNTQKLFEQIIPVQEKPLSKNAVQKPQL